MREVVIIDGARTPVGTYGGALRDTPAAELGLIATQEALRRSNVAAEQISGLVFGNVLQTSADAIYLARHIALKAGMPRSVPALVVQRLCGSGLQAIISAAQSIMLGEGDYMLAGGAESMSQAPHVIYGARWGFELGGGKLEDALWSALVDSYNGLPMAMTAENLAARYSISREQQDEFAYLSQQRTKAAQEAGRLAEEIVPITVRDKRGKETLVERDEHPRPDTSLEALARLKPRFKADGGVTAGNASGINDAGAAVVLADGEAARRDGRQPLGRLLAWGIVGVDPAEMGIGPAPAIRQALERATLQLSDIDLFEVNEAFAAQYIAVERELGLDRDKVNVNGGAIALGHPLAASGTRISLSLLYELRRRHARYGVAALCIGGGQGIAAVYENLQRL